MKALSLVRTLPTLAAAALLYFVAATPASLSAAEKNSGAEKKKSDSKKSESGWMDLFDGKSTDHFRAYRKSEFPSKGWTVENGALRVMAKGNGGDIVTKERFDSFELRFDWKVSAGANSGVMYRVSEEFDAPWKTGPEYQVLDDAKHADGKNPKTSAAALYALQACNADKQLKPVGEWNKARIVVKGNKVEHWLNKKKVVEYEFNSAAVTDLIKNSKFKDAPKFAKEPTGVICFQDHGDDVWFRKIKIRRLKAE